MRTDDPFEPSGGGAGSTGATFTFKNSRLDLRLSFVYPERKPGTTPLAKQFLVAIDAYDRGEAKAHILAGLPKAFCWSRSWRVPVTTAGQHRPPYRRPRCWIQRRFACPPV